MKNWNVYVRDDDGTTRPFRGIWASSEWEAKRHVFSILQGRVDMNKMDARETY